MKKLNDLLTDREKRYLLVKEYLKEFDVITLKANLPGEDKQRKEAYLLISYFDKRLKLDYLDKILYDNTDGPCLIYLLKEANEEVKEQMVQIEESTMLGRLIDIDVFLRNNSQSLNRKIMRRCIICDEPAFNCIRLNNHQPDEVVNRFIDIFYRGLTKIIDDLIDESIMSELNLDPKFGLVTPFTNGSHQDMDYELMIKAKKAIKPYLVMMFIEGYQNLQITEIFKNIRQIGQKAEEAMLMATKGVNCYKGLIFNLGLIIASCGYVLQKRLTFNDIFVVVKTMTKGITHELTKKPSSFGVFAYQKYQIGGARAEAENGYKTVQALLPNLTSLKQKNLLIVLIKLITRVEDTVLLKRSGTYQKYLDNKKMFEGIACDDEKALNELSSLCIKQNLSFGGSADLLIVIIFLKQFLDNFSLNF